MDIQRQTEALARELDVVGLINVQYAIRDEVIYVLEVNPRASRTVPFVSKAIGVPLAKLAARVMRGATLAELGFMESFETEHVAVKCPVFLFSKFSGVDTLLGQEMKSTGEVMGVDSNFGAAFAKAFLAAGHQLPIRGTIFISAKNRDKRTIIILARRLQDLGFKMVATEGTSRVLRRNGIEAEKIFRVSDPRGRNAIDMIHDGQIDFIINTPRGREEHADQVRIRHEAVRYNVPVITTIAGAHAAVRGIEALQRGDIQVQSLQEYHERIASLIPGRVTEAGRRAGS